ALKSYSKQSSETRISGFVPSAEQRPTGSSRMPVRIHAKSAGVAVSTAPRSFSFGSTHDGGRDESVDRRDRETLGTRNGCRRESPRDDKANRCRGLDPRPSLGRSN